jgi:hypothetical protein
MFNYFFNLSSYFTVNTLMFNCFFNLSSYFTVNTLRFNYFFNLSSYFTVNTLMFNCSFNLSSYFTDHWGDPGVDGRWIFRKWDVGVWTGLSWLRIGTGGGHLRMP